MVGGMLPGSMLPFAFDAGGVDLGATLQAVRGPWAVLGANLEIGNRSVSCAVCELLISVGVGRLTVGNGLSSADHVARSYGRSLFPQQRGGLSEAHLRPHHEHVRHPPPQSAHRPTLFCYLTSVSAGTASASDSSPAPSPTRLGSTERSAKPTRLRMR